MSLENEIKRLQKIQTSHFTLYWIYRDNGEHLTTAHSLGELEGILKKQKEFGFKCRVDRFTKNYQFP